MMLFVHETFGVWHEPENATGFVLQSSDASGGAIDIFRIGQRDESIGEVFLCFALWSHKAAFGVGDGKFDFRVFWEFAKEWAVGGPDFHFHPAAHESPAGVVDQAAFWEQTEFRDDLESIANPEDVTAVGDEIFKCTVQFLLGDQLSHAPCHDVVPVAKSTRKDDERNTHEMCRGQLADGHDFRLKPDCLQGACGLGIAVGAGVFWEQGFRVWVVHDVE